MADREIDIEVNDDNRAALEGAYEWLAGTSDADLIKDD